MLVDESERSRVAVRLVVETVLVRYLGHNAKRNAEMERIVSEVIAAIEEAERLRTDVETLRELL
jgi:hypothetical protein